MEDLLDKDIPKFDILEYPNKISLKQNIQVNLKLIQENSEVRWYTRGNIQLEPDGDHCIITPRALGRFKINIETKLEDKTYNDSFYIEVVNEFTPIKNIEELKTLGYTEYKNLNHLLSSNKGKSIIKRQMTRSLPRLYYIKDTDNKFLFEYKIGIIKDDLKNYKL